MRAGASTVLPLSMILGLGACSFVFVDTRPAPRQGPYRPHEVKCTRSTLAPWIDIEQAAANVAGYVYYSIEYDTWVAFIPITLVPAAIYGASAWWGFRQVKACREFHEAGFRLETEEERRARCADTLARIRREPDLEARTLLWRDLPAECKTR